MPNVRRSHPDIDVRLKGIGRYRLSAGSGKREIITRRKGYAKQLAQNGQLGTLRALKAGELTWPQIEEAAKLGRLNDAALLADIKLRVPLHEAIEQTLPRLGDRAETAAWYKRVLAQLKPLGFKDTAKVSDLACDWPKLLRTWDVSAARKNGLRRAVSRFLTRYLGDKYHPFRREVLHEDRWPILKQRKRLRGMTVEVFWSLMQKVPEECRAVYITLAASGMRIGELLNDAAVELDHANHIIYPEGKTGPGAYAVAPACWLYVLEAIPCRVVPPPRKPVMIHRDGRYRRLRRELSKASDGAVTLHDFRRLYARVGESALGLVATQTALGHTSAGMTADYARHNSRAKVADAVGMALLVGKPEGGA